MEMDGSQLDRWPDDGSEDEMGNGSTDSFDEVEDQRETEEDIASLDPTLISQAVVTGTDWTTETILSQISKGHIILNPRFQRRDAWTRKRKSEFIESLFLGFPVPQLVLAEVKDRRGNYIVLDGKQRLLSIRQFAALRAEDKYDRLRLTGLKVRSDLNGKSLVDIQDSLDLNGDLSQFENQAVRTVIIKNWPNEAFLYHVFLRLNTGSVKLSPQELRLALHPGPFLDFIDDASRESPALRNILGTNKPDFRMRDAELLVRYYAFTYYLCNYTGNLKAFLDMTSETLNDQWSSMEASIRAQLEEFEAAHKAIRLVFGNDAYHKWSGENFESRFNRAIYDVMMYSFRMPNERAILVEHGPEVVAIFKQLCADTRFRGAIERTTKSKTATETRLRMWCDALNASFILSIAVPSLVSSDE